MKDMDGNDTMFLSERENLLIDGATNFVFNMIVKQYSFEVIAKWINNNSEYVSMSEVWKRFNDTFRPSRKNGNLSVIQ